MIYLIHDFSSLANSKYVKKPSKAAVSNKTLFIMIFKYIALLEL